MDKSRTSHSKYDIHNTNKRLPVNLHKKVLRERRQRNEVKQNKKKRKYLKKLSKKNFKDHEHEALVESTFKELRRILAGNKEISDIPYDVTPEELLGEIALAEGNGMIIYVKRDDLSDLEIVLPQENPTIADLKRAIESTANTKLKRDLQQRYEERIRRREQTIDTIDSSRASASANATTHHSESSNAGGGGGGGDDKKSKKSSSNRSEIKLNPQIRSTGELVCSTTRNGHQHRANVSWRFLWRAYMLYHMETKQTLDDSNGRKLLSEYGIENAATLKFCKRENYYGRKRQ